MESVSAHLGESLYYMAGELVVAVILSFFLFKAMPPGRRSFLTALAALVAFFIAAALLAGPAAALDAAIRMLLATLLTWLLLWALFQRAWVKD